MKRIVIITILVLISFCVVLFTHQINKVNINQTKKAEVYFIYDEIHIKELLDNQEIECIKNIFNSKKLYRDNPSCGFSDNISIVLDETQTFCIAQDTCPKVYWKEKNMYFSISEEEKTELYNLLQKHGFFFPCL